MHGKFRMTSNGLIGHTLEPGLGRAVVCFAHTKADAGQVVDEEIYPVIGRNHHQHIRPGLMVATAEFLEGLADAGNTFRTNRVPGACH